MAENDDGASIGDAESVKTEMVAFSGDAVLAVGKPVKSKLLVSSATLSNGSEAFSVLFGQTFREGQRLGQSFDPTIVEYPMMMQKPCRTCVTSTTSAYKTSSS